ncbi:glutathione S-transferase family protein [Massilia agilis]|uniref:glutathione transferase n=1 Tax=Massilia agilis TaxID=1811226 RepID=A0ABT2DEM3_9BURK|nr:glutathione S-transferase family protein [Massilia agilis]MCS0809761.1 glutathione S-transferase family protein [Massilia agilis]
MTARLELVSHKLCPYVQRAAITLAEKGAAFERSWVDLGNRPAWFTAISPLGKVPLLKVDGEVLFESAVICDYLDETLGPRLHPADPLLRAKHRAWVEFGSSVLTAIGTFYNAPDAAAFERAADSLEGKFATIEQVLGDGPWFAGARFSLVDAAFGPVFRYFDVFDRIGRFGILDGKPKVQAWRAALAARPSVAGAVTPEYPELLLDFVRRRGSHLAALAVDVT